MNTAVVCGIDGSRDSWPALQVADELARRSGRRLEILHVTHATTESAQRSQAEMLGSAIRRILDRRDVPIVLECGPPVARLGAATRRAALVVIGTRGDGVIQHALRGSVSLSVARRPASPVLVVPSRVGHGSHLSLGHATLLCAVRDQRDLAYAATAACWARELGLSLTLVTIVPPTRTVSAGIAAPPPTFPPTAAERIIMANEELQAVAMAISTVTEAEPRTVVAAGSVGPQLRRLAEQTRAGIISLGPCRRGVIRSALARSPGPHLLRRGSHPVMICPPREAVLRCVDESSLTPSVAR